MSADSNLVALIEPLARMFFGEPNRELSSRVELRFGSNGSKAIKLKEGTWFDFEIKEGGGVLDLIKRERGLAADAECFQWLEREGLWTNSRKANGHDHATKPKPRPVTVESYQYHHADGRLALVVDRREFRHADGTVEMKDGKVRKTFIQRRSDPERSGQWIYDAEGVPALIYKLPEVNEAIASDHPIVIVEGERKVDLLWDWNLAATCNVGGSSKWTTEHSEFLRGADVIIVPDNDEAGIAHLQTVGKGLTGIAKRIRVVMLPGLPAKGDIVDWIAAGGTREQLDQLIESAPVFVATPEDAAAADKEREAEEYRNLIDQLATLSAAEYERERKAAAREIGFRARALDNMVDARRQERADERSPAPPFGDWEVEPWDEAVDTAELLQAIGETVRRYIVLSDHLADAVALWVLFAWSFEIATHSPILLISSSDPDSGKSTLIGVVRYLAPRVLPTVGISEAALFRSVEKWQPTLVIDEADTIMIENESLRAVINSSWTRGSVVVRCIGDSNEPHIFPTFTPLVLGMLGARIPASTKSRAIQVRLVRKLKTDTHYHFNHLDNAALSQLRRRARRWSMDRVDALRSAIPCMPGGFDNRLGDNWRLQFAIADQAGGDWPERARRAAEKISGTTDTTTRNTRLLAALKAIYDGQAEEESKAPIKRHNPTFIPSAALIDGLTADRDSEFNEWSKGRPITQTQLGRVMGEYGIMAELGYITKEHRVRGYLRERFEEIWERYL
jgi:hypothetical protein